MIASRIFLRPIVGERCVAVGGNFAKKKKKKRNNEPKVEGWKEMKIYVQREPESDTMIAFRAVPFSRNGI